MSDIIQQQQSNNEGSLRSIIKQIALDPEGDANKLEKLLDIHMKWEDREAKKAFSRAFADLQAEMPPMEQTKKVSFGKGGYGYTPLADYLIMAQPYFSKHQFCCRYDQFIPENAPTKVGVAFILTHVDGHSESSSLAAEIQPAIKGKEGRGDVQNSTQALAATVESLRRYTFRSLLCIKNVDDSIQERLMNQPTYALTEDETLDLAQKIEASKAHKRVFLECFSVHHLHEIPRTALPIAHQMLAEKEKQLKLAGGNQ